MEPRELDILTQFQLDALRLEQQFQNAKSSLIEFKRAIHINDSRNHMVIVPDTYERKVIPLTDEQRVYLQKVVLYWDKMIKADVRYTPEMNGKDIYIPAIDFTLKRATLNRILKRGEYNENEKEYLNKLKKAYRYFKTQNNG